MSAELGMCHSFPIYGTNRSQPDTMVVISISDFYTPSNIFFAFFSIQTAIVSIGKVNDKLVMDEDKSIKVAKVINLTMGCDHRVLDGAIAAEYMKKLRRYIENPNLLILN